MAVNRYNALVSRKIPPVLTARDQVSFEPHPLLPLGAYFNVVQGGLDSYQGAALMWLPENIIGATRMRWKYNQSSTAANTFYNLAVYDRLGIKIVEVGSSTVFYTGAAAAAVQVSNTIAATTFMKGWYYVWIGNAPATTSTAAYTYGVVSNVVAAGSPGVPVANLSLYRNTGGQTAPADLSGLTDASTLAAAGIVLCVPLVTLSIG